MQTLHTAIAKYNEANAVLHEDADGYNRLVTLPAATDAEVTQLETTLGFELPAELRQFYLTIGGLENTDNGESYCISVPTAAQLTESLNETNNYFKLYSPGVADMMRHSWGNDRPEFTNGYFHKELLDFINTHYRSFGFYRTDTILESAHYLYFDTAGKFGAVFYDQDTPDYLKNEFTKMRENSPASLSLEAMLCKAIEDMRITLIQWRGDDLSEEEYEALVGETSD